MASSADALDKSTPASGTALGLGDDQIRANKLLLQDVFGLPDATSITNEAMDIAADGSIVINNTGADLDFRIEGDNNPNMVVVDAGTDAVAIGGAVITGAVVSITPGDQAKDLVTSVGTALHIPADSQAINAAGNSETKAIGAMMFLGIPTWTSVGTSFTITDAATLYIQGLPVDSTNITHTREYALWVDAGLCRFDDSIFINETINTNMTTGITIQQGAADNEGLALKSSDVGHSSADTESDTYGYLKKLSGANGGLLIEGLDDTAGGGLRLNGDAAVPDGTHTTSGVGVVQTSAKDSGAAVAADKNIFAANNGSATMFIVDTEGQLYAGVGGQSPTDIDEWDDVGLTRALTLHTNPNRRGIIMSEWDKFITYGEKDLIEIGVLSKYTPGYDKPLLNLNQLGRLHNGAIWQLYSRQKELEQKLLALEAK